MKRGILSMFIGSVIVGGAIGKAEDAGATKETIKDSITTKKAGAEGAQPSPEGSPISAGSPETPSSAGTPNSPGGAISEEERAKIVGLVKEGMKIFNTVKQLVPVVKNEIEKLGEIVEKEGKPETKQEFAGMREKLMENSKKIKEKSEKFTKEKERFKSGSVTRDQVKAAREMAENLKGGVELHIVMLDSILRSLAEAKGSTLEKEREALSAGLKLTPEVKASLEKIRKALKNSGGTKAGAATKTTAGETSTVAATKTTAGEASTVAPADATAKEKAKDKLGEKKEDKEKEGRKGK